MTFIPNKYTEWYNNIISNAQNRKQPSCYTERHHIIPKSLGGGNSKENLVVLTAKEHFICHRLLVYMTTGISKNKMINAIWWMCGSSAKTRYIISVRTYKKCREQFSKKEVSEETRKKLRESGKRSYELGRPRTMLGKKHSKETCEKIKNSNKGKHSGPKHSEESKKKLSILATGRIPWNKGKKGLQISSKKGKTNEEMYGIAKSEEIKRKQSDTNLRNSHKVFKQ